MKKYIHLIGASAILAGCQVGAPVGELESPTPDVELVGDAPASLASADVVAEPEGLSANEKILWDSLTPAAKREAVGFIANGGTLAEFLSL